MQLQVSSPPPGSAEHQQIVSEIQAMCLEKLSIRLESPSVDLFETGILDSMGLLEVLLFVETRFEIKLPMEELSLDSLKSLDAISELVTRLRGALT